MTLLILIFFHDYLLSRFLVGHYKLFLAFLLRSKLLILIGRLSEYNFPRQQPALLLIAIFRKTARAEIADLAAQVLPIQAKKSPNDKR
ncbi:MULTISPECIES: hypothetical protein [unclassified Herbaspirillum]|uniref:hypothetical protein n=1 Tax=unclassified Herbaspirillum TaxID=2624150 RepID=UPI001F524732|nr:MULTISPECIES: hypothetical protein [unclassified Herbaspirillum]MCI1007127.1 hypothetical protein [Herbaspirillum sp. C7C8]HZG20815.1 hypothetical protein [Herbaspirillum sp.]